MRRNIARDICLLSLPMGLFLLLKSYGLNPALSDENIYFYDAWLMARGAFPYRDFFFAHPPFHLIPGWLTMRAMGDFSFTAMKLLPVAAAAATGICLYRIVLPLAGRVPALTAFSLFAFSYDLLRASSHWTGINGAVLWMTIGLLCALRQKAVLCGIALGFGVSTGVYVVPGALVVTAIVCAQGTRTAARCLAAAVLTCLVIHIPFWVAGGREYLDGVFRYHFLKPPRAGLGFADPLGNLLFHNFFLLAAPLYLLPVLAVKIAKAVRTGKDESPGRTLLDVRQNPFIATGLWCLLACLGYVLFLSMLSRVYHYYFLLLFPFSAVCAGLFTSCLMAHIRSCGRSKYSAGAAVALSCAVLGGFLIYPRFEHTLRYYPSEKGKVILYPAPLSRMPDVLQRPVRLVWPAERTIGRRYSGIQYYLWHESRVFSEVAKIVAVLRANAAERDLIFGDSATTPLVALWAKMPVVDHIVDTNTMRFRAGLPPVERLIDDLTAAMRSKDRRLEWILVNPVRGIGRIDSFRRFLEAHFYPFRRFPTRHFGTYLLMRRKPLTGPSGPAGSRFEPNQRAYRPRSDEVGRPGLQ